jgi:CxxC motif-containing protein (DUF1111 family)
LRSAEPSETIAAGGKSSVDARWANAYSFPIAGLSASQAWAHDQGDGAFEKKFALPPSFVDPLLGPAYNNTSCEGCHHGDGRGQARFGVGFSGSELVLRVAKSHGTVDRQSGVVVATDFGRQIRDHSTSDEFVPARIEARWIEVRGTFADGKPYLLREPRFTVSGADGHPLSSLFVISPRLPPAVFGLGLLENVDFAEMEALADPLDSDGDGISGRVNWVWNRQSQSYVPGRLGWKAGVARVEDATSLAFAHELGVSTAIDPEREGGAELDEETRKAVTMYMQTLAVPNRRSVFEVQVQRGEDLFKEAGCDACHTETLHTGPHEIPALAWQEIHPYTDLLVHNMGFDLADGFQEFEASGTEWRTPPLWGLGLAQVVSPGVTYLHDGRAQTVEEAILWHGGEAEAAKEAFRTMPASSRDALLKFLDSL